MLSALNVKRKMTNQFGLSISINGTGVEVLIDLSASGSIDLTAGFSVNGLPRPYLRLCSSETHTFLEVSWGKCFSETLLLFRGLDPLGDYDSYEFPPPKWIDPEGQLPFFTVNDEVDWDEVRSEIAAFDCCLVVSDLPFCFASSLGRDGRSQFTLLIDRICFELNSSELGSTATVETYNSVEEYAPGSKPVQTWYLDGLRTVKEDKDGTY